MPINVPTTLTNILHIFTDHNYINTLPTPTTARRTPTFSPSEDITALYPQIHGEGDLSSLLDPLHPCLRREIIKYGEFAQATYDSFDFNPFSEYCGSSLYNHHKLFDMLDLSRNGYDVTSYVYAMSHVRIPKWFKRSIHSNAWSNDSNWMGYVGVSNDAELKRIGGRDIVVAWRGTIAPLEWVEDIKVKLECFQVGKPDRDVKVQHGFLSVYTSKSETARYNKTSASEQVMKEIQKLVNFYKGRGERVSLTITGHSLGVALALLNAYEAALTVPELPVAVVTFGGPRVGNASFKAKLRDLKVKVLRVVVKQDVVPKVPGVLFDGRLKRIKGRITRIIDWVYKHVGLELGLNSKFSPYLKDDCIDLGGHHNLETYLHLVDGFLSTDSGFREKAKRDFALVNKSTGMLKEKLKIPESWNQLENKGLIRNAYGRWVLPKREEEDIPSPFRNKFGSIAE